jgi:hypothetical protein
MRVEKPFASGVLPGALKLRVGTKLKSFAYLVNVH